MPTLHIRFLGGLTLTWGEASLPSIPNVAARSLLAYLVTFRDRTHTRDLLAGIFWPDLPDATARRRLSRALWEIRRAFRLAQDGDLSPRQVLLTEGDTVQFNPALPLWLDVEEFNELVHRETGRLVDWSRDQHASLPVSADRSGRTSTNLPALRKAVELYQGDFLAGYYDDWLQVERERLQEMFLTTLEQLTVGYKSRGEYEQALVHARRLAIEDPWREEAHREVMRLCHLLGKGNEALRQFETCRQIIAEELDAEPSPETVALVREIATRAPAGRGGQGPVIDLPKAPPPPAAIILDSAQALELPLVGREQERAELLSHVQTLLQGMGGIVLVEGEAGVGKTRLLQTVARDAEWRGVEVLWGERQETEPSVPYGLLVEALADGLSPLRASQLAQLVEGIWLQVLAILLPSLVTYLPGLAPPPPLDPSQERDRLVAALIHLLTGWGRIKPLLIVLENLHWAGEDTLDVLSHLTPLLSERGVLVIGSYRGEDARALPGVWENLQALDHAGVQHRLSLSGLDGAATGELIRRSLGMGTPVPLFETRLYQETQGNPLFVLETLRALYGEGLLAQNPDGHWSTPWDETTSDYAELPLPRAVEQTIARRLAFLSSSLQQVIHLAAVLGERFDFDLLHAASHEESHILLTALRELVQRRFLDETAKDYRFSHDKIRQVAYDSIDARERSQLHLQIAQALEARLPDRVAALAHHWTESEVWDKAADYHQQAGDRARAVYANAEAAAHYTQALAALERLPEPPDPMPVFALRLAREAVYGLQGERAAQAEDLAVLEALAKRLDDARLDAGGRLPAARWRAEVALRQANYRWAISDYPTTIVAAQAAIDLAQTQQAVELEAAGYLHWGQALWSQGNYEAAETQLGQALALARDAKLSQVEADALRKLGLAYWHQGNNIQAKACFEQALRTHRDIGDRQGESEALNNLGLAAMHSGDYAEANTHLEQALHIHHEIGDWRGESVALNYLGLTATHLGNHAKARDYLRQSLRMGHKTGDRQVERKALTNLGKVSVTCGQYAEAKACCQQVLRICREIGDQEGEGWGLIILSLLSHHLGDYKATQEYSQQALRIAQDLGAGHVQGGALTLLGHAFAGLGQLAEAADAYRQALILQRELGQHNEATESLAGLAHVALNRGDTAQAYDYIEELLKHLEMNTLHGAEEPFLVYLICCRVLQALQDPRASDILKSAHSLLQEEAAKIGDEELRRSFLENVKAHREIIAAYRDLEALQPGHRTQVRLPRADAPTGRALRDDEYTTITWTVDAPGDEEIPRKTDRRRYRILRLLAEAQAQDAVPRDQDLAAALGVSLPTLRRDMAVLRSEGHELPTRGRK